MSDRELLQAAIEVLRSAQLINKFTGNVWISVDRTAWDTFMQAKESESESDQAA